MRKTALQTAGVIFLIAALLHAFRLLFRTPVMVGKTRIPLSVSWFGLAVSLTLAVWMFLASFQ